MDLRVEFDKLNTHTRSLIAYCYYSYKDDIKLRHYCTEVTTILDDIYAFFWEEDKQFLRTIEDNDEETPH